MYELSVERVFSAAHAIVIAGEREPVHGHNWRLRAIVAGAQLDSNGLLCDFHLLEQELDRAISPFHNRSFNDVPPFDRANPTAENIAKHFADVLTSNLPKGVRLVRISITEAPGCEASWIPS